jgi:glycosyltransferase involved in cell wall biosynthesis
MSNDVRIAFFVPSLTVGGAQRVTVTLANGLAHHGYDVDLVLSNRVGDLLDQVGSDVTVIDLNTPSIPGFGILASIPRFRSYLDAANPAVLFGVMTHVNVVSTLVRVLAKNADTKLVLTEHNTFGMEPELRSRVSDLLARYLYNVADHVVAVSTGVATSVVQATRLDRDDVTVLYNPVPVADVQVSARESVKEAWFRPPTIEPIVSVGRIEPPKDYETLLRAFAQVHDRRPTTRLVLVGRGPEREKLSRLAESLGVSDAVSLPGYVENPYAYIGGASVFVLSSRYEGLPTVLIEALAAGCPIVATDCPSGPREILNGDEYGRLVPVDDVSSMHDAITATLDEPPTRDELRRRADDFSTETVIEAYSSFIDRLIG